MKAMSKTEKVLMVVSFCSFLFSITSFFVFFTKTYNERVEFAQSMELSRVNNGINMFVHTAPEYHILFLFALLIINGFMFVFMLKSKWLIPRFVSISFSFLFFVYWFFTTPKAIYLIKYSNNLEVTDFILYKSNGFDFLVFICVSILFFWQISYYFSKLINTYQGKNSLP